MAGVSKEEKKAKIAEGLKPKLCYNCLPTAKGRDGESIKPLYFLFQY
jgi:hypothetical protein